MVNRYVWVRIRKEDQEKIVNTKKIPMEQEIKQLTGKYKEIKNPQLFKIAANSTWDLGINYQNKIIGAVKIKKGDLRI